MKIYFLSSFPCALTVNGAYFGVTDGFSRFAEVCLSDRLFLQFTPEHAQPISFFLDEQVRFTPPSGCEVYRMPDALAIYAKHFPPTDLTLRPIAQCKGTTGVATLYRQGEVYLSVTHENGTFIATLSPEFATAKLSCQNGLFFLDGGNLLAIYDKNARVLFCERVTQYRVDNDTLSATLLLSDSLQRTADGVWRLTDYSCQRESYTIKQPSVDGVPPPDLLSYAFFESMLFGGDILAFLAESMHEKVDSLQAYLGNFREVVPTNNSDVCALIYPKEKDIFDVKYCKITRQGEKIIDLSFVLP